MNRPAPRSRRPGLGFAAASLGAIALLAALGTWQVERLHWKEDLIAKRRALLARPAVTVADPAAITDLQPVIVTGTFRHDDELLVGPRTWRDAAGWRVITPLALPDGAFVLVDRGWVPDDRKSLARRRAGQVAGVVTVEGIARFPGPKGVFAPDNEPAKDQWFRVSPAEMAARLKLPNVAGWWLAANGAPNPGGLPIGGDAVPPLPNNHLQYAITWYGLAVAASVIAGIVWVRGRRPAG